LSISREVTVKITVNGEKYTKIVPARTLLVHFIRNQAQLTGTHVGCDTTQCGACTVELDGVAVKSCTVLAVQADGSRVTTIEGIAEHEVQDALRAHHGLQCGYCTPGMVMAIRQIIADNPHPTENDIKRGLNGNICRCTGYLNIVAAALEAASVSRRLRLCPGGLAPARA
jgi:aerobic carbon-monoxide dehydrogenase small subunit